MKLEKNFNVSKCIQLMGFNFSFLDFQPIPAAKELNSLEEFRYSSSVELQ